MTKLVLLINKPSACTHERDTTNRDDHRSTKRFEYYKNRKRKKERSWNVARPETKNDRRLNKKRGTVRFSFSF